MGSHKIVNVKIVPGYSLNSRWKSDMQVIDTDQGKGFIDNMPGVSHGHYYPGFDWNQYIGKVVSKIQVIPNSGCEWLNRPPITSTEVAEIARQEAIETTKDILGLNLYTKRNRKGILIFGATAIKENDIIGIAKKCGIDKDRIVIENEWKSSINIDTLLINCSQYDWLLIGPTAHNLLGLGDYPSLISRVKGKENVIILSELAGSLKINKQSVRQAFDKIAEKESVFNK
jgi:hypothetical protein